MISHLISGHKSKGYEIMFSKRLLHYRVPCGIVHDNQKVSQPEFPQ